VRPTVLPHTLNCHAQEFQTPPPPPSYMSPSAARHRRLTLCSWLTARHPPCRHRTRGATAQHGAIDLPPFSAPSPAPIRRVSLRPAHCPRDGANVVPSLRRHRPLAAPDWPPRVNAATALAWGFFLSLYENWINLSTLHWVWVNLSEIWLCCVELH
jgi:hypothetical protein